MQPSTDTPLEVHRPRGYGKLARRAAPLLNQQCWCWGCDVRRPEGNLLLAHGFSRRRVPPGKLGSSSYTIELDATAVVVWGFGLFWGQAPLGAVFLPRLDLSPHLMDDAVPPSHAWELCQLGTMTSPTTREDWTRACLLLSHAFHWVASYETWIGQTCGPEYRVACVSAWRKHILPADEMPAQWHALADTCHRLGLAAEGATTCGNVRAANQCH